MVGFQEIAQVYTAIKTSNAIKSTVTLSAPLTLPTKYIRALINQT